jgi:predicted ATPase
MPLRRFECSGYRSLLDVGFDLARVTVLVGANGSGKSNIYRALHLAHACADGGLARTVVAEGGMPSIVHAGTRSGEPRVELGLTFDDLSYQVTLATAGRGGREGPVFPLDPVVTHEQLLLATTGRPVELLDRQGTTAFVRDDEGTRVTLPASLLSTESVLAQLVDAHRYPELVEVRESLRRMRFHQQVRTDEDAPARRPGLATRTLAVSNDGADLPAALLTILRMGDGHTLRESVRSAFGGAELHIDEDGAGRLDLQLTTPGRHRALGAAELSDGQLRFLFLAAALLAPRPPIVVVLNEPEASLHPELLVALADLILAAGDRAQVVVTTHANDLAQRLLDAPDTTSIALEVHDGVTTVSPR